MGLWIFALLVLAIIVGVIYKLLDKLTLVHLEFGELKDDDPEPRQIKAVRPRKQLKK
jgi:uncharacterized membrane protein (DUF106 family)